jgi:hypothetical protein
VYQGMNKQQRRALYEQLGRLRAERAELHTVIHNPDLSDDERFIVRRTARALSDAVDFLDALVGGPRSSTERSTP